MLAHNASHIVTLVPESIEMIKSAEVEKDMAYDSASNALASYLDFNYITKVAGETATADLSAKFEKVAKAVKLYGIEKKAEEFVGIMLSRSAEMHEKSASEENLKQEVKQVEQECRNLAFSITPNIEKAASIAYNLVDSYGDFVEDESVKQMACQGWLNKQAAFQGLGVRSIKARSKDHKEAFTKLANFVQNVDALSFSKEDLKKLCDKVVSLEKEANLYGFNFYTEAVSMNKMAAVDGSVNLGSKSLPLHSFCSMPKEHLKPVLSEDLYGKLTSQDPAEVKQSIDAMTEVEKALVAKYL